MHSTIDVTVAAIVARGERFLMVEEQAGGQIVFNQPAGHLEPGESLIDAVIRETREETGCRFSPDGVVGVYLWHCDDAERSFLRVTFSGAATEPNDQPQLDDGILAAHWLTRNELLSAERNLRSPLVIRCLDDFCAGNRYPLECLSYLTPEISVQAKRA